MKKAFKFLGMIMISFAVYAAISSFMSPMMSAKTVNVTTGQKIQCKNNNNIKNEKFKMNPFGYEKKQKKELTDAQKEKIQQKIKQDIKTTLDYFVSKGKITQEDADKVINMITENSGKINFSDFPQTVKDAYKDLETFYSTLTEQQKKIINETIKNKFQEAMKKLVDEKKITEEQSKNIEQKYRNWNINLNLTDDQESLIFEMARSAKESALEELVKTNIITAEQAEMLKLCGFKFKEAANRNRFKFGGTDDRGRIKFGEPKDRTEPKYRGKNIIRSSFA